MSHQKMLKQYQKKKKKKRLTNDLINKFIILTDSKYFSPEIF